MIISKKKVKKHAAAIICFITAVILGLIFALPLLWMVMQSFQSDSEAIYLLPPVLPDKLDFSSYRFIFSSWNIFRLFSNTMIIVVCVSLLTVISSTLVGYGFARIKAKGKNLMFTILLASSMLPFVVTLVPSYAIWSKLGFLGTFVPLIVPSIGGGAFNIFLVRMFIMNIPETLDDVSQIDGCNRFQTLWYIIFPNLKAVLATVILFTYIGVWGDYVSPSLYLWGYTNKYTLSIKLAASFKSEFGVMDWPKVMSACTLISIPVLIIVFVFQNALVRGIVTSGLKD